MNASIDLAGWTLVHFVWQGSAIAAAAGGLLWLMRRRSPGSRYVVACVALVAMLAAPIITARALSRSVTLAGQETPQTIRYLSVAGDGAVPDAASIMRHFAMTRSFANVDIVSARANSWLPLIVLTWIAGVTVLFIRLLGGWWRIHRLHGASRAAEPSVWTNIATRIADTLGLSRHVQIVDSSLVDTPTVIGWLRPVILLPVAALAGLSSSQVEAILAHELAHVRRHDFLVNVLQTLAETVLFYHPAVWWLSARIRVEREHCCDEVALAVCGNAISYAEALVALESWRVSHSPLVMAATGGSLMARVRRLLGAPPVERQRSFSAIAAAGVVALLCVAAASAYLAAAQPQKDAPVAQGSSADPASWSMVFNHEDSTMRFIGFRGRDLIRFAYQIPEARVIGGPSWLDEQSLQIVINLDAPPRADEMPGIARQALEARLQLKTHFERRNFPVLALVRVRPDALGPGIRAASRPCFDVQGWIAAGQPPDQRPERRGVPACGGEVDSPRGTQYASITMPDFAEELRAYVRGWPLPPTTAAGPAPALLGPSLVELRAPDIVDRTGLRGRYDVDLYAFYPTAALMSRFPFLTNVFERLGFTSIPRALSNQLGLALVQSEAPDDVVVIDQVERP